MNGINKTVVTSVCVAAWLFTVGQLSAATSLVPNFGFETGQAPWTVAGVGIDANASFGAFDNGPSAPGSSAVGMSNTIPSHVLSLQGSTPLGSVTPGVTVDYSFDVKLGYSLSGASFEYHIFDVPVSGPSTDLGPGTYVPTNDNAWHTVAGSFTAPADVDHLAIEFDLVTGATSGSAEAVEIDNVLINQVPEPTTVALVGLGLVGAVAFGRRRRS